MKTIRVQASPSFYICEQGAYEKLEPVMIEGGVHKALLIHGQRSLEVAKPYLPTFTDVDVHYELYRGECSHNEIERMAKLAEEKSCDAIIGIGGGKIMDLAKAAAANLNIPVLLLPTLASQCASWTPLSVIYTDSGDYVEYQTYIRNPWVVLIEPNVLVNSPVSYLRAGIGDTLAKWYEAKALTKHLDQKRVPVQMALKAAELCKDTLLVESDNAIASLEAGQMTDSLLAVIETNILAGGLVGGLGDEYGRIAAAHSFHNALTQFQETHSFLHGEKVAYGILVQLALEGELEQLEELLTFYKKVQLPSSLTDLGLEGRDDVLNRLAELTLSPKESIHFMAQTFTNDDVIHGIKTVEAYNK